MPNKCIKLLGWRHESLYWFRTLHFGAVQQICYVLMLREKKTFGIVGSLNSEEVVKLIQVSNGKITAWGCKKIKNILYGRPCDQHIINI